MQMIKGRRLTTLFLLSLLAAVACGGDDAPGGTPSTNPNGTDGGTSDGAIANGDGAVGDDGGVVGNDGSTPPPVTVTTCVPGTGKDYQVGPGAGQIASIDLVPWEKLAAGDTVRFFYRTTPYVGKFAIGAQGTATAPIRICGVKGPNGERPIIDGSSATTRTALSSVYGNKASDRTFFETSSLIAIKHDGGGPYQGFPAHIQIDGLSLRRVHPSYSFTDSAGTHQAYAAFSACIWMERGHDITILDNEISDCSQAIYTKSTDEGDFAVSKNIRISRNSMFNCGVSGDDHIHTTYTASSNIVYELNHFGARRAGAMGNSIKDRSAGLVVRFNRIDDGAHAIDLVEAEDFPMTATADPAYRSTFVYGNQITKSGDTGSFIHYGGDHYGSMPGANWGEPWFRKGTLYFFSNTVYATGGSAHIFQLSTTEEKAEVWNNVIVFASSVSGRNMRQSTDNIGAAWTAGGIVNLGRNWISSGWVDSDANHHVPGQLNGSTNVLSGAAAPIDLTTFAPLAGSAIIGAAMPGPAAANAYPVDFELDAQFQPKPRPTAADLGALEH